VIELGKQDDLKLLCYFKFLESTNAQSYIIQSIGWLDKFRWVHR